VSASAAQPAPAADDGPLEGLLDSERRLEYALDVAYRYLGHRDRTVVEVRRHLAAREIDGPTAARALSELERQGYLDDARFARRFAEDRRTLDGWGTERIEQRLLALGIEPELIAAALASFGPAAELSAAVELLRRRFPEPPRDPRTLNRALGLLVRRGYELELAHDAIRQYERNG
jgi:regulatory protein